MKSKIRIQKPHAIKLSHLKKSHRVAVIAAFSTIGVLIIGTASAVAYYNGKAAPGSSIGSTNIGGQNADQLAKTIDDLKNNIVINLSYGGKHATAKPGDIGLQIDTAAVVKQAQQSCHTNPLSLLFSKCNIKLIGNYSQDKLGEFIKNNFPELTTDPVDAQINYDKNTNRYRIKAGAIGKSVEQNRLNQAITSALDNPGTVNYEIATVNSRPAISDESAQKTADEMNSRLEKTIAITNDGKTLWTIDPWTIADWTEFKHDVVNTNSPSSEPQTVYTYKFDKSKIKNFVSGDVVGQLPGKPVNSQVVADANGETLREISAGQDGKTASNTDEIVDQIYDMLSNNTAGNIEMKTKDTKHGVDKTTAKDGHWIEYNLSTYTVTLYDGKNATWSTDQTSQGKPSTPTITGLHQVWHKVYEQCMPNPPSPNDLCGIHYVTYWERSGYAFHEAWWMNQHNGNVRSNISHGCINMYRDDAKRVYDWSSIGTPVWVHY